MLVAKVGIQGALLERQQLPPVIARLLDLRAKIPDVTAVISPDVRLTFHQLACEAAKSAAALRSSAIGPGTRIGISVRDNAETMILVFALWMLGAVVVPIDFRTRPAERRAIVSKLNIQAILQHEPPSELPCAAIPIADVLFTDREGPDAELPPARGSNHPALLSLSSGTTGSPSVVAIDHDVLANRVLRDEKQYSGGRLYIPILVSFLGSMQNVLRFLLKGETVIFASPLISVQEIAERIISLQATAFVAVPTFVRGLLDLYADRTSPAFPALSHFQCNAAPILPHEKRLAQRVLSAYFFDAYSCSLVTQIAQIDPLDVASRAETVGRPLPDVTLEIVDSAGKPLPPGSPGPIRVKSPRAARLLSPDTEKKSGDRLIDGWVYTGDVGSIDADGFLTLHGRDSDVVIRGGENIYPAEIEAVGAKLPGVREIAVVGYPSPRAGEELAAFIVPAPSLTLPQVIAHFRSQLRPSKCPRQILFVRQLSRNNNGKVLKRELREKLEHAGDPVFLA